MAPISEGTTETGLLEFVGYFSNHQGLSRRDFDPPLVREKCMGLRISTNIASLSAQRNLGQSADRTSHAMQALASGNRIVHAGDDAAGFAISEGLRNQIAALGQAKQNAQSATGFIQVAEGALNEQNNIVVRMRELAVQASSDTVGDEERGYIDKEFQQLLSEVDRVAQVTRYGQRKLLVGGNQSYEFQVGTGSDTSLDVIKSKLTSDTRASSLGLNGSGVSERSDARDALDALDSASSKILEARAGFGALQSRLNIVSDGLDVQGEAVSQARSRISDADVAHETAELTAGRVQQDLGTAVLAQANAQPNRALRLLY